MEGSLPILIFYDSFLMREFHQMNNRGFIQLHSLLKKGGGFTLVELIVVIALIVFITGLTIINLRPGEEDLLLQRSVHQVAQDSRNTIGITLRSKPHECGVVPMFSGYGMNFTPGDTTYILFSDCNGNLKYQPADDVEEVVELAKGVRIQSVTPLAAGSLTVLFVPPNPDVFINGDENVPQGQIVLELINDTSRTRTLTISNKGVIDID